MDESNGSESKARGRRSKVDRVIEEYDLGGLGAELEELWTAEEDRRSLRDLADYFNQQVLAAALEDATVQPLDGEIENTYRLLTDEGVSSAESTRVKRRLERDGVDVETLMNDFVTYQAIRTYLKDHRSAEYTPNETDPKERVRTSFQKLRGRMVSVMDRELEQLQKGDDFDLGEFRTLADIQVVCEDCNTNYELLELLDRGGCQCTDD